MEITSTFSPNASETINLVKKFQWVADDLAIANTSFYLYKKLVDARRQEFRMEIRISREFWRYTIRAHEQTTLACLCRVYDSRKVKDAFHLLRLVEEIDESMLSDAEKKQRQADLEFLQKKSSDAKVAKLRKWRNNLLSHSNENLILSGYPSFRKSNEFLFEEIQHLIDQGILIMERWAIQYGVGLPIKKLAQERDDYLFVLESLRLGLQQQKETQKRSIEDGCGQ